MIKYSVTYYQEGQMRESEVSADGFYLPYGRAVIFYSRYGNGAETPTHAFSEMIKVMKLDS